ncbi:TPA: tail fiber domain-containing protein [Escherichia coli]|uniref:phage tail fiber protein n=1 Tax=Escherichia coli TaxID=562 RepID=UPI000BB9A783|nr:tail fiber domain-containing protein [Escherichia coli]HAJ1308660.1 tail fiber domain-containing protein [Escherichia coli]HAJ1324822.1 tail fiber domain-containing protein [Escherichia coli]HAJ1340888.1 tail fiber domain-containing protein [Escherichia coli]HAJ1346196.1 tail fiber domain-containing protein [Escherichia coli]HAJ1530718.1 tail fiber domain-containing protein [Escherichia coli]
MQSIQFKRTQTAGKKPTPEQLSQGEIALQLADHVIYTKDKNNNVVQISVSPEKHAELNTKVDQNKTSTDRVIASNKQEAANNLASAKAELNQTITAKDTATNKRIDATNTTVSNLTQTVTANKTDADTMINNLTGTVSANKTAIERTVAANKSDADSKHAALTKTVTDNNTAINNKVNTTNTNVSNLTKTVTANKTDADNKISSLTSTVAANKTAIEKTVANNKKDADTKITNLTGTVNSNHTAINNKVDQNKSSTDAAIAAANQRIDSIEGSADAAYIKKNTNTYHHGYLLSKTANYFDDAGARNLDYFGAFRPNNADGWGNLILNIPHSGGKAHGRGFEFHYGSSSSQVKTYGFDKDGNKRFSYRMYHEGDKPTPTELGVYSKAEVDQMFTKPVHMSTGENAAGYFKLATATIPQGGRGGFIRIFGGNGYNVNSPDQCDIVEIVIRSGNGNPKGVNVVAYRRNTNNEFETFAVNTSGDNYDVYVKYRKYTDKVTVEYGKSADVTLNVYDTPELTLVKPSTGVNEGRVITLFNTENKRGTLSFDNNSQATYDIVSLSNTQERAKKYLRKFRSQAVETIWHETVEGSTYRLATGTTDADEKLRIDSNGTSVVRLFTKGNNAIRMERRTGQSNYMEFMDYRSGANRRQGYLGYGDGTTNTLQLVNELTEGNNSLRLDENGQVSLSTGKTKIVYTNGEYVAAYANAFRMIYGNYGAFWRNDGGKVYLLSTAENDKFGGWNGNRPFIYDLSTGKVTLGGDGNEGALVLERDSRAARFAGDIYVGKGMLTFDAGRLNSRDYFRFNHWGDSNNARDNILQLDDSKGAHFSTERTLATGAIKTKFFGDLEAAGQIRWGKGTATSSFNIRAWGSDSRKQVFECADESGWHWYSQRAGGPGTNEINFSVNGSIHSQGIATSGNVKITGPDIEFRRSGNKHLWFRDPNGLELGLLYCDDAGVMRMRGEKQAEVWKFAGKMIHLETGTVSGGGNGLIRGAVAGGSWASWRDRASGLQVDCQQTTDSAHNVWKATHQGKYHIAAMGVHVPSGTIGNAMVRMHVHDATFDFNAAGDFSASRNGSFNDVYIRSDSRLKINKEELQDGALEKVNSLKVYTYDKVKSLKDRSVIKREVGIIAQDLEEVLPEAVGIQSTEDPENPEAIKTISNSAVNALIIKAIQEMDAKYQAKIEALTKEIAELKATK